MTDLRQAAQQALEALERADKDDFWREQRDAITALKAALKQQAEALQAMNDQLTTGISIMLDGKRVDPASVYKQAEPVALWQKRHPLRTEGAWENTNEHDAKWWSEKAQGWEIRALYTTPLQPLAQPISFAGLTLTAVRVPFGMTVRFEENALIVETVHNVKDGKTPAFISCDAHGNIISKERNHV